VETKDAATNSQIDPASAESFIAEKRIGERIKRLRLKKSMGLVELGRHTGLCADFTQSGSGSDGFQQRPFLLF
jgi:hypothetical protein